jgi:peptidoglycan-N-acetylglucosamine deacetylase
LFACNSISYEGRANIVAGTIASHARIPPMNPWLVAAPAVAAAAAGVSAFAAIHPRSELFGSHIHSTAAPKKLAITFDDGPNPAITPKLLDLFDKYNAHATFFVIGKFVREVPSLLQETVARGHSVGNHTETHPNLFFSSPSRIREELERCNDAITEALGVLPRWFRPPFGLRNPWVLPAAARLRLQGVMWTVIPGDWSAPSTEWLIPRMQPIAQRVSAHSDGKGNFTGSTSGDILCLHDGYHGHQNGDRRHTVAALEYWLPRWRDLGLEFVTIDAAVL